MMDRTVPPIHVVTDDDVVSRDDFVAAAEKVMGAGGEMVALHLRAPRASGRWLHATALRLMERARAAGSLLIVNDRVNVAMAVGAHGIQLGRRGIAIDDARRMVGDAMRIGASVHSIDEAREVIAAGCDWLLAGSIHPTESHPGQPGAGVGLIEAMAVLGRPVIAIGGITPGRVREARDAGASGVAAIRGIWDHPSPETAVRAYIDAWQT